MKARKLVDAILTCLMLAGIPITAFAQQGESPDSPVPVGVAKTSEIFCGESAGSLEPYDATITLVQLVRGNEAWERLKSANSSNKPAKAGYEYILARISFSMKARVSPGNKAFDLGRPSQFIALSADSAEYEAPSLTAPKPELARPIHSGESAEGWIVFLVQQKEGRPVMMFDPASGGAMGRGKTVFFQLY